MNTVEIFQPDVGDFVNLCNCSGQLLSVSMIYWYVMVGYVYYSIVSFFPFSLLIHWAFCCDLKGDCSTLLFSMLESPMYWPGMNCYSVLFNFLWNFLCLIWILNFVGRFSYRFMRYVFIATSGLMLSFTSQVSFLFLTS